MCFIKKNIIPKIATKDILVYKDILIRDKKIVTPCTRTPIPDNGIIKAKRTLLEFLLESSLEGEGVHSFLLYHYRLYDLYGRFCVKAYVPKGTLYFENKMDNEVCSRQLKVTNELVDTEFYLVNGHLITRREQEIMHYRNAEKIIIHTTSELLNFMQI